jgi:hypothetical protein
MTKLKVLMLSLIVGLACFSLNPEPAVAQTEAEFEAEFNAYASNHTNDQVLEYVSGRLAGMTAQAIVLSELETDPLGVGLNFAAPGCNYAAETQICRNIYMARLAQLTGESGPGSWLSTLGVDSSRHLGIWALFGRSRHSAQVRTYQSKFRKTELLHTGQNKLPDGGCGRYMPKTAQRL